MMILDHFRIAWNRNRFFVWVIVFLKYANRDIYRGFMNFLRFWIFLRSLELAAYKHSNVWWLCFEIRRAYFLLRFLRHAFSYWCTTWSFSHSMWQSVHTTCFSYVDFDFCGCAVVLLLLLLPFLLRYGCGFTAIHQTIFALDFRLLDDIDVLHFANIHVCIFDSCFFHFVRQIFVRWAMTTPKENENAAGTRSMFNSKNEATEQAKIKIKIQRKNAQEKVFYCSLYTHARIFIHGTFGNSSFFQLLLCV